MSRLIARLAEDADGALAAISSARAVARERVWNWAGAPTQDPDTVSAFFDDLFAEMEPSGSGGEDRCRWSLDDPWPHWH